MTAKHGPDKCRATIVIPVRNGESFIGQAIKMALCAATSDTEVLIVDDDSSDRSLAIAAEFAASDSRVRVAHARGGRGVAAAREVGVHAARGRYIWLVDVDDDWPADALAVMLEVAERTSADLVLARALYVTPSGRLKRVEAIDGDEVIAPAVAFRRFLLDEITGHLWNKLLARSLALSIEYVPTVVHSDQSIVAQAIGRATRVATTASNVYHYIQRPGSLVRAGRLKHDSLVVVQQVTHCVAASLTQSPEMTTALDFYDLRSIALPQSEDILDPTLSAFGRSNIRRRTRLSITRGRLRAARSLGARRLWLTAWTARSIPPLYEVYLRAQRVRSKIRM